MSFARLFTEMRGEKALISLSSLQSQYTAMGPTSTEFTVEATIGRVLAGPMRRFVQTALVDLDFVAFTKQIVFQMGQHGPVGSFLSMEASLDKKQATEGIMALRMMIQGKPVKGWRTLDSLFMVTTEEAVAFDEVPETLSDSSVVELLGVPGKKGGTRALYLEAGEVALVVQDSGVVIPDSGIRPAGGATVRG